MDNFPFKIGQHVRMKNRDSLKREIAKYFKGIPNEDVYSDKILDHAEEEFTIVSYGISTWIAGRPYNVRVKDKTNNVHAFGIYVVLANYFEDYDNEHITINKDIQNIFGDMVYD